MIRRILLFLILQSFIFTPVKGAENDTAAPAPVQAIDSLGDDQIVSDFLLDPKNPFLKLTPPKKKVVEPPSKKIEEAGKEKKPEVPIEEEAQKLKIGGMVWGTDEPQAIVNDQIVSPGDKVENLVIFKIGPQGITVKNEEGSSFLIKNEIK